VAERTGTAPDAAITQPALLAELAVRVAEAPEASAAEEAESGRSLTFAALWQAAGGLADALRGAGLRAGHRVIVAVPNSLEWLIALYGSWRAGATPVLMNHSFPDAEMASLAASVGAAVALTDRPRELGEIPAAVMRPGEPPRIARLAPVEPAGGPPGGDSPACIIFTSGTEGRPKPAVLRHAGLANATRSIATALRGRPGPYPMARSAPPSFICLPLSHSGGLTSLLFAFHVGRRVVVAAKFSPSVVAEAVRAHGLDTLVLTPTMLGMLLQDPTFAMPGVRVVQSTGAGLAPSLQRRFEERFRVPVIQNYGQTETAHIAGWTKDDIKAGNWRPGSVGRPYPDVGVEIRDEAGSALPAGQVGEITVRSAHLMLGYEGGAADSGRTGGWVATGDLGYLDGDGYLFVVDRKREMIICGGFNIYPAELEALILEHPGVAEVAVVGAPDERLGEIPVAYVVPAVGARVAADEIVAFTRQRTAHFRALRGAEIVDALPTTVTEKVHRSRVRALAAGSRDDADVREGETA
jgi:long-chain acyl-CoA synthetase